MLEELIIKYLMKTISLEEYKKLQERIEKDEKDRHVFVEYKNIWVIVGLIIGKSKTTMES